MQCQTEYGQITYLMGSANLDRMFAMDLIGLCAAAAVGYFVLVIVSTCLKARRRYVRRTRSA